MDSSPLLVSLPAIIALLFKIGIFVYARASGVHTHLMRLYLYFLFALSIQNVAEISHFYTLARDAMPYLEFTVFYAALVIAVALLLHLAISMSFRNEDVWTKYVLAGIYSYAVILVVLLIFTPWVIADLVRLRYTATRVPGPLFPALEVFVVGGFFCAVGIFARGARHQDTSPKRAKATIMLLAIIPMAAVMITVFAMLHFNVRLFNATVINPVAITFFLAVTVYAIHQHRLFDIQFFIPWSKVRKRKSAFYERIRALVAEIADLGTVNQAIGRLAETLRCPVALVGGNRSVLAFTGGGARMTEFPKDGLRGIDRITVANEIADSMPDTHALMRQYGIAAIVPFYPHSRAAASWMLLGESFSEQVYTPLDFKMVEQLFDKMAELFLDRMIHLRTQLADAQRHMRILEQRLHKTEENLMAVKDENSGLREQNSRLLTDNLSSLQTLVLWPSAAASERASAPRADPQSQPETKTLEEYVSEFEAQIIKQTLERCNGNKSKAARILGLRPNTLHYKLERYGLVVEKKKTA